MMDSIFSQDAPKPVGPYPHAKRVGPWLFLSGVGPRNPQDNSVPGIQVDQEGIVTSYDISAETRACFENVMSVLTSVGLSLDAVVDITVFLVNIKKDFKLFNEIYGTYFDAKNGPARTTLGVTGLPTTIHVELKVLARFPDEPRPLK